MKLLIAGIDPGTTAGYALLGLDGSLVSVESIRHISTSELMLKIIRHGRPIIAATDVFPAPKYVERFAAQVGARLIAPPKSMQVGEKNFMTRQYSLKDDHERDSLAAALFAYKKLRHLIRKINFYLKRREKEGISEEVTALVITKHLAIADAIELVERKPKEAAEGKPKIRTESIKVKFDEAKYLRQENEGLKQRLKASEEKLERLRRGIAGISRQRAKDLVRFRQESIESLNEKILAKDREIALLKEKASRLTCLMLSLEGKIAVPRLSTLSLEEVQKKAGGKIIFVDNPNIFSEHSLKLLKGSVSIIVSKAAIGPMLKGLAGITFIDAKSLSVTEEEGFVLVSREEIEREKGKKDILKRIIEDYKKERE